MFPGYLNTFLSDIRFSAQPLESGIYPRRSGLFLWSIARRDKAGVGCTACYWGIAIPFSVFLTLSDLVVWEWRRGKERRKVHNCYFFLADLALFTGLGFMFKLTLSYGCFCGLGELAFIAASCCGWLSCWGCIHHLLLQILGFWLILPAFCWELLILPKQKLR